MRTTRRRQDDYASTALDEQEVVVRLERVTGQAHITSCCPTWSRRLTRLYGPPHRVVKDRDGHVTTAIWRVPANLITFRRPGKPRVGNPGNLARARTAPTQGGASRESLETTEES